MGLPCKLYFPNAGGGEIKRIVSYVSNVIFFFCLWQPYLFEYSFEFVMKRRLSFCLTFPVIAFVLEDVRLGTRPITSSLYIALVVRMMFFFLKGWRINCILVI